MVFLAGTWMCDWQLTMELEVILLRDCIRGGQALVALSNDALECPSRGARQQRVDVEVSWLLHSALIHCPGRCQVHHNRQQLCTSRATTSETGLLRVWYACSTQMFSAEIKAC